MVFAACNSIDPSDLLLSPEIQHGLLTVICFVQSGNQVAMKKARAACAPGEVALPGYVTTRPQLQYSVSEAQGFEAQANLYEAPLGLTLLLCNLLSLQYLMQLACDEGELDLGEHLLREMPLGFELVGPFTTPGSICWDPGVGFIGVKEHWKPRIMADEVAEIKVEPLWAVAHLQWHRVHKQHTYNTAQDAHSPPG